jgi:hypothetical protein
VPAERANITAGDAGPMDAIRKHAEGRARYEFLKNNLHTLQETAMAEDRRRGMQPFNANTVSASITTEMLAQGAITILQHQFAPLRAFARDFSADTYKPKATIEIKYVTSGPTAQTDPTDFESGNSTIAVITPSMAHYTGAVHVSQVDMNKGMRIADLLEIGLATLGNTIIDIAVAPITVTNFTATPVVSSAANFGWSDAKTLWGQLKKSPIKNLLLDGEWYARLLPENMEQFQPTDFGRAGWNALALNTRWSGAGTNVIGFACNPQAIGAGAGLPVGSSNTASGLSQSVITLPGLNMSIALFEWFSNKTRSYWASYEMMFGAAVGDTTAGICVKSA